MLPPSDTDPRVWKVYLERLRQMTPAERAAVTFGMMEMIDSFRAQVAHLRRPGEYREFTDEHRDRIARARERARRLGS